MTRLAIITTHPIQYYAPLFRQLTNQKGISIKVFYTFPKETKAFDSGFGKAFAWDIPLLDGYEYCFANNKKDTAKDFFHIGGIRLISQIKNWKATAILVFGWNYLSHLKTMIYFKGKIPVLFRGDSTLLDEKSGLKKWLRRISLTLIYKNIDYGIYVGEANRRYYLKHNVKKSKLIFGPHAIDNERFLSLNNPDKDFILETKLKLKITDHCISVLYCGKFQPTKNPMLLIKAVKAMNNKKLHLIMVGDGELKAQLLATAAGEERIHFLPFQNQSMMPAIYRLADIFCLPSVGETWGLAVNEAMACSKAVIVSDRCGCSLDLVKQGVNGYVFKNNDVQDLTAKLNIMISERKTSSEMGSKSFEIIQHWNFTAIANSIHSIFYPSNHETNSEGV